MAQISQAALANINLSVVRRYNPAITSIVTTSSYVVVYIFNHSSVTWDRLGIEGTLFVCALNGSSPTVGNKTSNSTVDNRRSRKPKKDQTPVKANGRRKQEEYELIVLNRRSLENFIIPLTSPKDMEASEQYIIFRSRTFIQTCKEDHHLDSPHRKDSASSQGPGGEMTYGIWVWTESPSVGGDKERITNVIRVLSERVAKSQQELEPDTAQKDEEYEDQQTEEGQAQRDNMPVGPQFEKRTDASRKDIGGVPMTSRSISLTELFQQQRIEDGSFAVHSHMNQQQPPVQQRQHPNQQQQQPHLQHLPPFQPQLQHLHHQQYSDPYYQHQQQQQPPRNTSPFRHAPQQQQQQSSQNSSPFHHQPHPYHAPNSFQQHYTQHSHQSMPPPPQYLPTPAPPTTGPIYPTPPPPLPPLQLQHHQQHPHQASSTTSSSHLPPVMNYHQPPPHGHAPPPPPILTGYNIHPHLQQPSGNYQTNSSSGMPPRPEYPIPGGGGGGGSGAPSSIGGGGPSASLRGSDILSRLFQSAAAQASSAGTTARSSPGGAYQ